jgi:hypothetical protein
MVGEEVVVAHAKLRIRPGGIDENDPELLIGHPLSRPRFEELQRLKSANHMITYICDEYEVNFHDLCPELLTRTLIRTAGDPPEIPSGCDPNSRRIHLSLKFTCSADVMILVVTNPASYSVGPKFDSSRYNEDLFRVIIFLIFYLKISQVKVQFIIKVRRKAILKTCSWFSSKPPSEIRNNIFK